MAECFTTLSSGVEMCFETYGKPDDPAVLLVMGLGGPMGWWTTNFCEALADRGFRVVRYDNRDTGRSTKFRDFHVDKKTIISAFAGRKVVSAYGIEDLTEDAFALLDHLGIDPVHVVGVSMGGMIAQTMAINEPGRVLSLTSIMSTTGNKRVGWQHPRVIPSMLAPASPGRDGYVIRSLKTQQIIGSPAFESDRGLAVARAEETFDRGWSASGVARQMLAVLTQDDRTDDLAKLTIPVTVVHGLKDPLVHVSGGRATARAVAGAEFVGVPGMGHDLPVQLYPTFIDAIERTAGRTAVSG